MKTLDEAYSRWRKKDSRAYVAELIRQYKPNVMLTHDINGEYGHGRAQALRQRCPILRGTNRRRSLYARIRGKMGDMVRQKLYLHLGRENTVTMDWRVPLSSMGGKTGLELAQEAYAFHITQHKTSFAVTDEGRTSNAKFSLVYSSVGGRLHRRRFF